MREAESNPQYLGYLFPTFSKILFPTFSKMVQFAPYKQIIGIVLTLNNNNNILVPFWYIMVSYIFLSPLLAGMSTSSHVRVSRATNQTCGSRVSCMAGPPRAKFKFLRRFLFVLLFILCLN